MNKALKENIDIFKGDFEFIREMRYFDGSLLLEFGSECWSLKFKQGELHSIDQEFEKQASSAKIKLGGSLDDWNELLKKRPKPFFQCFQSAAVKHGMQISDTNETFAYLPGINRLIALLREINEENSNVKA